MTPKARSSSPGRVVALCCVVLVASAQSVEADWIEITHAPTIIFGDPGDISVSVVAHSLAVINGPGGGFQEVITTDGTTPAIALYQAMVDGQIKAASKAVVLPAGPGAGFKWVSTGPSWNGNGTFAVMDITMTSAPVKMPTALILNSWWMFDSSLEELGGFFAPGGGKAAGSLDFSMIAQDVTSGQTLFHSTTVMTQDSPDIFQDDMHMLTWVRNPGFFDGLAELGDFQNAFSDRRWTLQSTMIPLQTDQIFLNPGESLNREFMFIIGSFNSTVIGPDPTLVGVFDQQLGRTNPANPEPSTLALLAVGVVGVLVYRWRMLRRATSFDSAG